VGKYRKCVPLVKPFSPFLLISLAMRRSDFHFELPRDLIAQYPIHRRDAARMLILDGKTGDYRDGMFTDLPDLLQPGDLLVLNDTRVIPARLYGLKDSGGKVEILIERLLDNERLLAQVRASKTPKPGTRIHIGEVVMLEVEERRDEFHVLRLLQGGPGWLDLLEEYGHMPLPPYIQRAAEAMDAERYQTVYANEPGAVAAPTAGLHFTDDVLARIAHRGVDIGYVTLHVGAGTFQPVRAEEIENHRMHSEWFQVDADLCEQVRRAREGGGRIVAAGTTVVRCLESATGEEGLEPVSGETAIFIYPGYRFRAVDCLLTNFHLPESTLLMLVCAFAGRDNVLRAYRYAVEERYRFFSYGDAMFLTAATSDKQQAASE
jgi:S-adenosylmethionine:tRNA ribosyltransferase-isomerase